MADITVRDQGNVSNEGQVNWRGDQVSVPQGGQSIYDCSTIQLAQLGARKVVGDRVFRYAKSKADLKAGDVVQYGGEYLASIAYEGAVTQPAGMRSFTITAATAISANTYAEGYLTCEMGATDSNLGMTYRIKSNLAGGAASTTGCDLVLYDEIKCAVKLTSTWSVSQNLYMNVDSAAANNVVFGVSPIDVTTGDYFWLQTWGPAPILGTAAVGNGLVSSVSGKANTMTATTGDIIGPTLVALVAATNYGLCFVKIAP